MVHKILVGVDGSIGAWHALDRAVRFAAQNHATVIGLFVESPFWTPPGMGRGAFESVLRAMASRVAQEQQVPFEFRVRQGYPAHTIAEQAQASHCDLIVLGHTGDAILRRWFTLSVSSLVALQARCPVVVLRQGQELPLHKHWITPDGDGMDSTVHTL